MNILKICAILFALANPGYVLAQHDNNGVPTADSNAKTLFAEIMHMDSMLFKAFNDRSIEKIKTFFSEDLEFYHDQGGVTNYAQNMESFRKVFESDRRVRRELITSSVEVCAIREYGAVQTGSHRFYATEKGHEEKLSSEAKFITLWKKVGNNWKITRIISYAHDEKLTEQSGLQTPQ